MAREGIFNNNSAVNDSDDKSGNSNGNRGIGAEYLIRPGIGAQVEIGRAAVLVPILLSGKLQRCLLFSAHSPGIGLALNGARRNPVLTLTWRDTLYTRKSNACLGVSAVNISATEISRKIIYISEKVFKKILFRTFATFYLSKNRIIYSYLLLRERYFSYLSLNYPKRFKKHRYRPIERKIV